MIKIIAGQLHAPALGFGTWQLTGDDCRSGVENALEIGYRHIDTAQIYENETEVGAAIAASGVPRDEVFLTTKVWYSHLDATRLRDSFKKSLDKLQTDYVDLLLVHWPVTHIPLETTLDTMFELADAGKVRHVGVSNFTPALIEKAVAIGPIACNQVEYHPYLAQEALTTLAFQHDFMLTAYSPLARGRVCKDETLQAIGEKHGKSAVQVTLRWFLQQENVAVIPKASSAEHRAANFDVFDFELTDDEMDEIDGLDRQQRLINPRWAPEW